jgi:hypothetical protein
MPTARRAPPRSWRYSSPDCSAARAGSCRLPGRGVQGVGDTLSSIGAEHRVAGGWNPLFALNRRILSSPNMIYPAKHSGYLADRRMLRDVALLIAILTVLR